MKSTMIAITGSIALSLGMLACTSSTDGLGLFKSTGCIKCHKHKDVGIGVIDISEVTKRRTDQWIYDQITNPKSHDANTGMPSFGDLSDTEVNAIIRFLHEGK